MPLSRRNFLGLAVTAAPLVFVPKLITGVNWGVRKLYGYENYTVEYYRRFAQAHNEQMLDWYREEAVRMERERILFEGIKMMDLPPGSGDIKFEPA